MGGGASKAKKKAEEEAKAQAADEREKELSRREAELAAKEQELAAREAALQQGQDDSLAQDDPLNQSGLAPLPPRRAAHTPQGAHEAASSRGSTALPIDDDRESRTSSQGGGRRRSRNRRKSMFFAEEIDVEKLIAPPSAPPTAPPEAHRRNLGEGGGKWPRRGCLAP